MSIHRTEPAAPPAGEHLPALAQWAEVRAEFDAWWRTTVFGASRQHVAWKAWKAATTREALRAHLSAFPPVAAPRLSDEQIEQWAERHDIAGDEVTLRAIFEDARSLLNLSAPLAERPQGERQEDSFNQPVNDAQGASPASRSRAPSGEESAPTEPNDSQNSKESHYGKD